MNDVITDLLWLLFLLYRWRKRYSYKLLPTPPTDEQDEHISVPVIIGKYFILEVSLVPGQGSYAQCWCMDSLVHSTYEPAFNVSSALQYFVRSNTIKIRKRIMFDFYPGLPHIVLYCHHHHASIHHPFLWLLRSSSATAHHANCFA